ncbi:MAG: CBS domain-containing protein [Brevinematia bacterium]
MPNELDDVKVGAIIDGVPPTIVNDLPVSKAVEKMLREKVHSLVVIDKNGKTVGLVSAWDVLKVTFLNGSMKEITVSKLIEGQKLVFVYAEVTLRDALNLMIDKEIHALPVLDYEDKLVGRISLTDIARFVKEKLV